MDEYGIEKCLQAIFGKLLAINEIWTSRFIPALDPGPALAVCVVSGEESALGSRTMLTASSSCWQSRVNQQ
jgi:hypothetical protein